MCRAAEQFVRTVEAVDLGARLARRYTLALRAAERAVDGPFDSKASLRVDRRIAALEAVQEIARLAGEVLSGRG